MQHQRLLPHAAAHNGIPSCRPPSQAPRASPQQRVVLATASRPTNGSGAVPGPTSPLASSSPRKEEGSSGTGAAPPRALSLAYESEKQRPRQVESPVKTIGLHRAPLSGGVKSATNRFDLPKPPTAVRNLLEHARFAHLCTTMSGMHHRRSHYPFGTLIDFAADGAGHPIFCLSPLAIHTRNIIEEPRSSLVVEMPGWMGLSNARVTMFGDVHQLPPDMQAAAQDIFFEKHSNERKERWVSGNFVYFRMNTIVDIYFVGGFGTVQWIEPREYLASKPDDIVLNQVHNTLQVLNATFAAELTKLMVHSEPIQELVFISIDATGADIRVRCGSEFFIERLGFDSRVHNQDQAVEAVRRVVAAAQALPGGVPLVA